MNYELKTCLPLGKCKIMKETLLRTTILLAIQLPCVPGVLVVKQMENLPAPSTVRQVIKETLLRTTILLTIQLPCVPSVLVVKQMKNLPASSTIRQVIKETLLSTTIVFVNSK